MPRQDGTGPSGSGPLSGRGYGKCNSNFKSPGGFDNNRVGRNRRRFLQNEPADNNSIFSQLLNELNLLKNRILHLENNR